MNPPVDDNEKWHGLDLEDLEELVRRGLAGKEIDPTTGQPVYRVTEYGCAVLARWEERRRRRGSRKG